jgi:hypothetical protein
MINNGWKCVVVCFVLFCSVAAWSATKYSRLEESKSWASCIDCAGGKSNNADIASSPFHSSPSRDGSSRDFWMSGSAYSNALWWHKIGTNNTAKNFSFDFWMKVASNTSAAQAFEFDAFQFISGRRYMFGTECSYGTGVWDIWDSGNWRWIHTNVPCKRFVPNVWYHVTMTFHRTTGDKYTHYDKLAIVQYKSDGKTIAANNTYWFNKALPSGKNPAGWSDTIGVQFQMDIGRKGAQMQEWVDQVSLTAW